MVMQHEVMFDRSPKPGVPKPTVRGVLHDYHDMRLMAAHPPNAVSKILIECICLGHSFKIDPAKPW